MDSLNLYENDSPISSSTNSPSSSSCSAQSPSYSNKDNNNFDNRNNIPYYQNQSESFINNSDVIPRKYSPAWG